ncbi:MAG: glycosyltransferase [Mycobacterium sp.]
MSNRTRSLDASGQQSTTPLDPVDARRLVGLAGLPTILAVGPFDDHTHARQLADAFVTVRKRCTSQLVLLGAGAQRSFVTRHTSARGVGSSVHVVRGPRLGRWSELVAAADLVVLGDSSETTTLVDVLALGRPVVAPADPATVHLLLPAIAGLVYPPGDASVMAAALLRLLTDPALRRGMGGRARNVARRHRLECDRWRVGHIGWQQV